MSGHQVTPMEDGNGVRVRMATGTAYRVSHDGNGNWAVAVFKQRRNCTIYEAQLKPGGALYKRAIAVAQRA